MGLWKAGGGPDLARGLSCTERCTGSLALSWEVNIQAMGMRVKSEKPCHRGTCSSPGGADAARRRTTHYGALIESDLYPHSTDDKTEAQRCHSSFI